MNPVLNPYSPGAGSTPPELTGRDTLLEKASVALQRIAVGRSAKSLILTGLRGVGKTVLLNRIRQNAEAHNIITVRMEALADCSLPGLLAPGLQSALIKLNRGKPATELAKRALRAFATFVHSLKLKYHDLEISVDNKPGKLITSGLGENLTQLLQAISIAAKEKKTAVVLFIDELQVLDEKELSALIMALHIAAQDLLPITLVAAGLPQTAAKMGKAKTYAERLFEFIEIGELDKDAATQALTIPAEKLNVRYTSQAIKEILKQTKGYAYFLQEWGQQAWNIASHTPISEAHAKEATLQALAGLDASFFRIRFEQLTAMQKHYLRAMAELGAEPVASGKIAELLNKKVTDLGKIREQLISKGLIYSPAHGETAFTVPLFDSFMKRVIHDFK
ncbi:MAG: AAA family ATPase [Gammaproteobacteria bacterium RIFCSPHIGHO2_02_FULL_39_13]|nr:MAG: AAA family ATPase [Gammaproteobacteria bacterium RIFCSPHIGHO2_02_FULL_39_13]OGT49796.1 MAG: AAA family ATPase [Gammaproteobacteria bacterium RIFCSPHIGHO2_12_FULL_39_24]